jgi:actin-related protein 9
MLPKCASKSFTYNSFQPIDISAISLRHSLVSGDTKTIQQLKESKGKKGAAATHAAAEKAANERAAQAAAEKAADVQTYRIASLDLEVKVGPIRHRACEPLYRAFDGAAYGSSRTVQEGMTLVMKNLEPSYRQVVWESIVFTGELAKLPCEYR